METKKVVNALSEAATARYCDASVITIRKYREAGKITPIEHIPGAITIYDADAVRAYLESDRRYQAFKLRRKGVKQYALNCKDTDLIPA